MNILVSTQAAAVAALLGRMGLGEYAAGLAGVDGAALVARRQADFMDDFGMREADALYLYGAIYNLWMNLKW